MRIAALGIALFLSISASAQSGQAVPARVQSAPEVRVQYEYMRITVNQTWNSISGRSQPTKMSAEYPDGRTEAVDSLFAALQQAGSEGWELVAVDSDHELGDEGWVNRFYILKRVKR